MASILPLQSALFKSHMKPDRCSSFLMPETGPAQQLFNVGNRTGAAAFCIGIQAGALDTAKNFHSVCCFTVLKIHIATQKCGAKPYIKNKLF